MLLRLLRVKARLATLHLPVRQSRFSLHCRLYHVEPFVCSPIVQPHRPPLLRDASALCESATLSPHGETASLRVSQPTGKPSLPVSCPGCGSLAQEIVSTEPGFYTRSRKAVRTYLKSRRHSENTETEGTGDGEGAHPVLRTQVVNPDVPDLAKETTAIPICDRCHDLLYNLRGTPIAHPSLEDIADSIAESPFSRNHIYHVLDAADFPMSLEPRILSQLSLAKPRSRNRRSQASYPHKPTLSFIITRSDLLAPTKEKVNSLMPYFENLLRGALGRAGENLRLGNVHLVSAKRGWWTKYIKDDIWKRGGGNWMVGKFNVGKSNLFEVLFPKGSGERAPVYAELTRQQSNSSVVTKPELLSEQSLLPPAQPELPFPTLPLVSNLPGTTASPIRLPFGNHKGELVDLPGLERGNLNDYVLPEHKLDLVMTERPKVSQHNVKPGQSLLLGGGVVRITPLFNANNPSTTMMAYPFIPLDAHVTSTEKAIGAQEQSRESGIKSIVAKNAGADFRSAGSITLDTDVTKYHAGPLLRAGVPLDRLPFRVYSTDLLIQGVGWVELVCQVRRRRINTPISHRPCLVGADNIAQDTNTEYEEEAAEGFFKPYATPLDGTTTVSQDSCEFPVVEVFTPQGKHISKRRPLGAWSLWKEGNGKLSKAVSTRPRQSMKGAKKRNKVASRES